MGQPPLLFIICVTSIYTLSISGLSSLSTFIQTKASFIFAATSSFSKDSCSITWHQWQVVYPIERKIGLSSSFAFVNASSPQGYQSTGFAACCSKYGLSSNTKRFQSSPPSFGINCNSLSDGGIGRPCSSKSYWF